MARLDVRRHRAVHRAAARAARQGRLTDDPRARYNATMALQAERTARGVYTRTRAVSNEFGFTKTLMESDRSEDSPE